MQLAVLFQRLGPYHHARLHAAAGECSVTAIEFSRVDRTYAWAPESPTRAYPIITLFQDRDILEASISEIQRRMSRALEAAQPDAVAVPGWSVPAALIAIKWCLDARIPVILMSDSSVRDEPRRWWREAVKAQVVQLASSALVGGAPHVEYITKLGMATERVFVGFDVVDNAYYAVGADKARKNAVAERKRLGLPEGFFLASNRFVQKKNLPVLLNAFDRYRQCVGETAWHLVLLGDGPLRGMLESIIQDLHLGGLVHLPGFQQYTELPTYYGLASAFVHASYSEQWGLVVNEAMASGLPVLVSNRCGCSTDLVADGENGFLFDPADVNSLTQGMLRLTSNNCDRGAMGRRSLEIIQYWTTSTFTLGLRNAAASALGAPRKTINFIERAMLWALMRRL